jgi:integrase
VTSELRAPTGHVFRVERKRGPVWYAKYRLPDGRQVQKKLGPAWTGRGRPPAGYFTKRTGEDWLRDRLDEARRGTLPGLVRTGATFADAAAEYLRYIENDRGRKPSTLRGYRSAIEAHLLPAFGSMPVEDVTTRAIEGWVASFAGSPRSRNKLLIQLHGILGRAKKVWGLPTNAAAEVEKFPERRSGDIDVFSPEEVWALVRAAESEQDAAIFLTAAFTGLRMGELLALHWRDVDFTGRTIRVRASY